MAADPRNLVVLTGGLVDTPEPFGSGTGVTLRLGVDRAGTDADNKDNTSGYFSVKVFTKSDSPNAKFVTGQLDAGNFKKGTKLQVLGRLQHERFTTKDGTKTSRVTVIAETINYAGAKPDGGDTAATGTSAGPEALADAPPITF